MYIWSHVCLVVSPSLLSSPSPCLYSLSSPLPFQLFSSSSFSVPPFPLLFVAGLFFCFFSLFLQHLLLMSSLVTYPSLSLCYPSHFSSLALFPPAHSSLSLNGLEMLLSFIWICLWLEAHSKPQRKSRLYTGLRDGSDETSVSIYPDMWKTDSQRLEFVGQAKLKCLTSRKPHVVASSLPRASSKERARQRSNKQTGSTNSSSVLDWAKTEISGLVLQKEFCWLVANFVCYFVLGW